MSITIDAPTKERENLYRELAPAHTELRDEQGDGKTLFGHFAVFNRWTKIDSIFEGTFMERVAPGAFKKTFREGRDQMRVLLNHGYDPELGDRPIASIRDVGEDEEGAYYEAELLDGVPELVRSGIAAGEYGASFRFSVVREEWNDDPGASDDNPLGLPERTLKEMRVMEFGPVTWGAYPEATSGLRWSPTDTYRAARLTPEATRLSEMLAFMATRETLERERRSASHATSTTPTGSQERKDPDAPSTTDAAPKGTSAPERRAPSHSALIPPSEREFKSALEV